MKFEKLRSLKFMGGEKVKLFGRLEWIDTISY